ncbi:MAG: hypothetical protein ACK4SY_06285 [Pyrobaculum sp.]
MIVKVVQIRDVAILQADVKPCGDVIYFTIRGMEWEICGRIYEFEEELEFRRGLLLLGGRPYLAECEGGRCVATRVQV